MSFKSWFEDAHSSLVRESFEVLLGPEWIFLELTTTGGICWRKQLAHGYSFDLWVRPVNRVARANVFQTTVFLCNPEIAQLESALEMRDCLPSDLSYENPKGNILSIYVEGFQRLLYGGKVDLLSWESSAGLSDPARWHTIVAGVIEMMKGYVSSGDGLAEAIFGIQQQSLAGSPSPIVLFDNPYLIAAKVSLFEGRTDKVHDLLVAGRQARWSPTGDALGDVEVALAECKARKIETRLSLPPH